MVDVAETVVQRGRLGAAGLCYIVFEARPIDTDDTVTLGELSVVTAAAAFRLDTGAELTTTEATNVVTITTAALVDVPVLGVATGY